MEHDGESGKFFHYGVENVECQRRGNELAFFVAGALFGSELVCAVAGTDRDSEGVATGAFSKLDNFFGVGICVVVGRYFVFHAGENAELTFHSHVVLVCVFNNFFGKSNVFFKRKMRTVDHNA